MHDLHLSMLLGDVWDLLNERVFEEPSTERLFNQYRDRHPDLDKEDAARIRRSNLKKYLAFYEEMPTVFFLAEAPGPWGCRFSGVPITSEAQLLAADFPIHGDQSSSAEKPHAEYCAGIHWRVLEKYFPRFLTWNTVPFHPHKDEPLSIRTPTAGEIDAYRDVVDAFLHFIRPARVAAVGRKAERALTHLGVAHTYVRHPSQGGAKLFERGALALLEDAGIA